MTTYPFEDPKDTPEEMWPNKTLSAQRLLKASKNRKRDPMEYDKALRAHMKSFALFGYEIDPGRR